MQLRLGIMTQSESKPNFRIGPQQGIRHDHGHGTHVLPAESINDPAQSSPASFGFYLHLEQHRGCPGVGVEVEERFDDVGQNRLTRYTVWFAMDR